MPAMSERFEEATELLHADWDEQTTDLKVWLSFAEFLHDLLAETLRPQIEAALDALRPEIEAAFAKIENGDFPVETLVV